METNTTQPTRRLERGEGPLGGVAAGLADYFNLDPVVVRLAIVAGAVIGFPVVPITYVAAWMIIPAASETVSTPPPPPPPVPAAPAPATAPATATATATETVTEPAPEALGAEASVLAASAPAAPSAEDGPFDPPPADLDPEGSES